jgi:hypothetical protein
VEDVEGGLEWGIGYGGAGHLLCRESLFSLAAPCISGERQRHCDDWEEIGYSLSGFLWLASA